MTAPKILVTRRLPPVVEDRLRNDYGATLNVSDGPLSREELTDALRHHDIVVPTITDRLDAALLGDDAVRVRLLANFGAGTEHIDLDAAKAAGIAVSNTPDALTETTAELAITLMLIAARRAGEGERELRAGQWTGWRPTHMLGTGLHGKVLGLVGFGRIARATARRATALGMTIAYYSRAPASQEVERALGARHVASLSDLVAQADVVSLHVPGGDSTRHMINADLLRHMKGDSILVNTARGSVIDESALADALEQRIIAAAALDVYAREPMVEPRLLALENVVLLPHLGSATLESRTAMGMQAVDNINAFVAGELLPNRVV